MGKRKGTRGTRADSTRPAHAPRAPAGPWRRRLLRVGPFILLAIVVGLGLWVRVAPPWPLVLGEGGEIRLFDTDSYFHLRHARWTAEHFPLIQREDPFLFPSGSRALYAGLYDVAIAAAAKLGLGVDLAAAFAPAILGAAAFVALFWLGAVVAGPAVGALAALLLLLVPGIFLSRTLLGYADHHAAEVVLGLATVAGLTRCLRSPESRWWWRPAALHALPLSLFLFTWYGAPLYVALAGLTLFAVVTLVIARGDDAGALARAATRYTLGVLIVIVPAAAVAPWLMHSKGAFAIAVGGLVAIGGLLPFYAWVARRLTSRVSARMVGLGTLALAAAIAMVVARLEFAGLTIGAHLLGAKDPLVAEHSGQGLRQLLFLGGAPALLACLALPLALRDAWRRRDAAATLTPVLLSTLVVAMWLTTKDYGYAAPAYLALLAALVIARAARVRPILTAGAVALAVIVPIWPLGWAAPPIPARGMMQEAMIIDDGWSQAMRWMRERTPPGRYGVRAFWHFGHIVSALGERMPLASGGISRFVARWLLLEDEAKATTGYARYTIADAQTATEFFFSSVKMLDGDPRDYQQPGPGGLWTFNERQRRTMISRLFVDDGDGLSRHRMVYASPQHSALSYLARDGRIARRAAPLDEPGKRRAWEQQARTGAVKNIYGVTIEPSVKIFEEVAGARLSGSAAPGARVEARLSLRAIAADHAFTWRGVATAGADGHYEVVAPYPTERAGDETDVRAAGPYELRAGGELLGRARVRVSDVREGREVSVR